MKAEQIARALGGNARRSDGWWSAKCPAHDDENPSFSVRDTDDGGVAYHCFAGCEGKDLSAALRKRGLLPAQRQVERPKRRTGRKAAPTAAYIYRDEASEPLFRVLRYGTGESKTFSQERYEAGKWISGKGVLEGVRRVLYRLPELLAAALAELVFLAEGEKDVDRLRGLGLVGTTNPQGAGGWHKTDSSALTGRHVVIVPDLDAAGAKYEREAAQDLAGRAASLRVLRLPIENPSKTCKDVTDWLDQCGGTREQLLALIEAAPPYQPEPESAEEVKRGALPIIALIGGQRTEILGQIEAALRDPAKVRPGSILARGHACAVLRHATDATKLRAGKVEITLPPRTAYLAVAKPEHMAALLDGIFQFKRIKRDQNDNLVEVPCDCPAELARYVLANAALLPLLSISPTPVLREDGSVLDQPGYDARTGLYYAPEIAFPPVPEHPTQEDARKAYEQLCRPFRAFPFVTKTDRAAVLAEVLTLLIRHLVPRAPAFLHHATEAGSGKTKLFDTVSIIALGANAALLNADILEDETELRKVLTMLTLAAAPLAVFDNVARGAEIRSPGLSHFLTATVYGDRLLGTNEEVKAATCTVIGLTGNGCEIAGDNTRRILRVDLDAGVERPELRAFAFDSEAEAREQRGALVADALTILRAHALAGRPAVSGRSLLGSFEDWDRIVCGALVFAGAPDPLALLEKTRTVDPERTGLAEVLRVMVAVDADRTPMKAGEIIRTAEEALKARLAVGDEDAIAEARDWLDILGRFGKAGQPSAKSLSRYLNKNRGRVISGMALLSERDAHDDTFLFRVKVETSLRGQAGKSGDIPSSPERCSSAGQNANRYEVEAAGNVPAFPCMSPQADRWGPSTADNAEEFEL